MVKLKHAIIATFCISLFFSMPIYILSCTNIQASQPATATVKEELLPETEKRLVPTREYNKKLVTKIDQVINALENDNMYYNWIDYTSCNVGLFAQLSTNSTAVDVDARVQREYADYCKEADVMIKQKKWSVEMSWKQMVNYYCGITGKPVKGIIKELQDAGFTNGDICNLEYLSDKYILSKAGINTGEHMYYTNRENFIKYLKAWSLIIKMQD